jgi:hypothetical protein
LKKTILFTVFVCFSLLLQAQVFSVATDFSLLRNISKGQGFWAVGQDVRVDYHMTEKLCAYTLVNYYTNGKVSSTTTATAKSILMSPQTISYDASTRIRYLQISIGLKRYFEGQFDSENNISLYGFAGFGLLFGTAETTTSKPVDSVYYYARPIAGKGSFTRLTADLGAGVETQLGSSIYLYSELRAWFPASSYPSPYLYNNDIPRVLTLNTGIRILID